METVKQIDDIESSMLEWVNNLTTAQLSYFKKEMIKLIII
jgi:hypothetical protein